MNRFDIVFYSSDQPATADSLEISWPPAASASTVGAQQTTTMELITRRLKPGASVRRLRSHRCSWPRRV